MAFDDSLIGNDDFDPRAATESLIRQVSDMPPGGPVNVRALNTRLARKLGQPPPAPQVEAAAPTKAQGQLDFSAQAAPPPPTDVTDTSLDFSMQAAPPPEATPPAAPSLGITGNAAAFAKGIPAGALEGTGGVIQGLGTMGAAAQSIPGLQDVAAANDLSNTFPAPSPEALAAQQALEAKTRENAKSIDDNALVKAGKAVKQFGADHIPMSDAEKDSIGGRVGHMAGTIAPYAAATVVGGPALGIAAGFTGMAADTYGSTYEEALKTLKERRLAGQHKASFNDDTGATPWDRSLTPEETAADEATARSVAGKSALVAGVLGSMPLGAGKYAKGLIAKVASSSAAFTGAGEAQEAILQQIKKDYDPKAGYTFDQKRLIAELILGAGMGGLHHAFEKKPDEVRIDTSGDTTRPNGGLPPPDPTPGGPDVGTNGPRPGSAGESKGPDFTMDAKTRSKMERVYRHFEPDADPAKMSDADLFNALNEHLRDTSRTGYTAKPETAEEATAREGAATERTEREALKRRGWTDAHIDAMTGEQRRQYFQEAMAGESTRRPEDAASTAQAKPQAGPEQATAEPQPEPASHLEYAVLREYGYSAEDISNMAPKQRQREVQDAYASGIKLGAAMQKHQPPPQATSESDVGSAPSTFTTAKGSTYEVHEDGTTTRNKAARPDIGHEGDSGPKERSAKTVYVQGDKMGAFDIPQDARWRVIDHGNGRMSLSTWNEQQKKWGISPESRNIPVSDTPSLGAHPLELWKPEKIYGKDAYKGMHPGNAITEIGGAKAAGSGLPARLLETARSSDPSREIVYLDADKVHGNLSAMDRDSPIPAKQRGVKDFFASNPESWNPPHLDARKGKYRDRIEIVDGTHRWREMRDLGMKVVPVEMDAVGAKKAREMGFVVDRPKAGARESPIKATTAEDVLKATPAEPTEAQAQAENYKHAHVDLEQLGLTGKNNISIETGVGQERKGIDPSGKPWSVTLEHAAYGRIKGTRGADGQPLDIFVGPHPKSPHVFVVDQQHQGGGFDEHKILAGFLTPIDALHAYANSYTDLAKGRIGGVTAMTADEFKSWLKGDTTLPLKKEPEKSSVRPLTQEPHKSVSSEPLSLLQFIASKGGLAPHAELDALDIGDHRSQIPGRRGFFGVVRPTGMSLDMMREAAEEAGYFRGEHNKTSTIRNLLDAIDNEMRGQRHHAEGEEGTKTKRQRGSEAESSAAARDKAISAAREDITAEYGEMPDDLLDRAAAIMADERLDLDTAVETAALRMVNEDADYGVTPHDITDTFGEGALDAIQAKRAPSDGENASPEVGQERGPGESEEAGKSGERVPEARAQGGESEIEATPAGEQAVIPGTEKISDGELAQRKADTGLKPTKPQKPADIGLFSDEKDQGDLLDRMSRRVEIALGDDADKVALVDIARASEIMAENEGMSPATAFGQAVIETAVDQGFITEPEAIEAYGKEAKDLLATGREGASGGGAHLEQGGAASEQERPRGAAQTGLVPGSGEAGEGGQARENGLGTGNDTAAASGTAEQSAADGKESANRAAAEAPDDTKPVAFPAYTTQQLRDTLADAARVRGMRAETVEKMRAELAARETSDGISPRLHERDAGSEPETVPQAAGLGRTGPLRGDEGAGSAPDVSGTDEGRAEGERLSEATLREGSGGASEGGAVRVSGRHDDEQAGRSEGAVRRDARAVKGENWHIEPGSLAEDRSQKTKATDNLQAIKLANRIVDEGRPATAAEQHQLARYVGWGGIKNAFPDVDGNYGKGFEQIGADVRDTLTPEEYDTARRSIQYAHYTPEVVIRSMWNIAQHLGFTGGSVFEPGMGVGHFAGMMPADLAEYSSYNGIELDHVSARIAHLLYPKWGVRREDFTHMPLAENAFDLAIGNPPFADISVQADPKYKQGFLLHDYFFAKSLDAVRPGGVLMFVTSAGTMNKVDKAARIYLSNRADLVGAIRLPNNAFTQNAGSNVTTDIVMLRKRMPGEEAGGDRSWIDTVQMELPDRDGAISAVNVNRYFAEHPEMILGEQGVYDKLTATSRYGVRAPAGFDLEAALIEAGLKLPRRVMREAATPEERAEADFEGTEKKDGSYYVKDGRLMQQRGGAGYEVERRGKGVEGGKTAAELDRIRGLVPIRDALRETFAADLADDAYAGKLARGRLNKAYDAFVEKFGPINKAEIQRRRPNTIQQEAARSEAREEARYAGAPFDEGSFDAGRLVDAGRSLTEIARARKAAREEQGDKYREGSFDPEDMPDTIIDKRPNIEPFAEDQENYRLRAIENYDEPSGKGFKGAVFSRNIITKDRVPDIKSINDAVLYVLNQKGKLDIDAIGAMVDKSHSEAIEALGDRIYQVPGTKDAWETREKYLSGNVRKKLALAKAEAARNPVFRRNVEALEAAQPAPLAPSQIGASLGMPWIPVEVIEQFGKEAMGLSAMKVRYSPVIASWAVSGDTDSVAATSTWGTPRRNATALLLDALNRQNPKIYDEGPEKGQRTLNIVATQAAQDKMQAIRDKFNEWIFSEEKRADKLASFYNENYNNLVVQDFDGSYLTTPGVSSEWSWRPHQLRGIARIIQDGNTYLAHAVGAGKTTEYIGAGQEMRRLGLVHKPMHVVPNHMLAQFTKEYYELYPTARIMVADERNFHTDRRKQFMANVALEDLDAVIITHSAFGMIPVSDEFQDSIIEKELDEYRHALADTPKDGDNRITRSRIEKQIERLEQRLSGKSNRKRDRVFNFDEMGVDFLFVDEAQEFRKLDFNTQMSNLKGITPQGSGKAWDLYVKSRLLDQRNPGRSLVLGSGTPVTNTMAELYTVSRYLQRSELEERQLLQFDAWAGAFGENVSELEQDAAGGYKTVSRFAKFVNVAELSAMVRQVMDVVTERQLEKYVTLPKLKGGGAIMNMADKSPALMAYQDSLARRMKAMEGRGRPKPGDDIMLKVIGDGRHAAIDMRLVGGEQDADFPSKLDLLIDNAFNIWKRTKQQKFYRPTGAGYDMSKPIDVGPATQMIFANLGISGSRGFSVPDYIRAELVRRGVPRNEIAFIADYKSHVAKQKLFNDMNEAKVRLMIGSTQKMGTGVNAQRRLYASHNLDPLWYPADDTQRNGRAKRQGNWNPEIERHAYSTKGTYDSAMWGLMEKKARFIQGFFEGDPSMRVMDDLGEASQYEQAKALTTNDPRLMRLTDLRQQYERANRRKAAFDNEAYAMRRRRADSKSNIEYYEARATAIEKDIAQRVPLAGDQFTAKVGKETFAKRADFGEALLAQMDKIATPQNNGRSMPIGEISGFSLVAKVQKIGDHMSVTLDMKRNGGSETHVNVGTSAIGAARSMESILSSFDADLAHTEHLIADAKKYLADSEGKQNDKFTGDNEIKTLGEEIRALQAELSKKDEPKPAPQEPEDALASLAPMSEETREELIGLVRGIVRHLVGDHVRINISKDVLDLPNNAQDKWGGMQASGARGLYFPWKRLIRLALIKGIDSAAFHEAYHAIEYQLQTPQERELMQRETPRLRDYVERARKGYTRTQIDAMAPEEIRAIAFEDYATARSKGDPEAGRGTHIGVRRWFDRLWQALQRLVNGLRKLGFQTYEDIFDKSYRGGYRDAPGDTPRPEVGPEGEALASIFRGQQNQAVNTRLKDLMLSTASNRFVERYQNLSEPVKRLQEAVEARSNGTLPDTKAFYTKKRLFPGKVGAAVQDFNKEHLDPLIEFAKDNKLSLEQVGDIAYALHAPERNAEMEKINHPALDGSDAAYVGKRSGMSDAEAAAILAGHSPAVINEIDHRLGAIRDFNLNTMVVAGLESQATIDAWKAKYQHYAPLSGWDVAPDDAPDTTRGVGNFNVRGPETKRAFGRRTKAANPLVNILDQSYRTIERAKRNEYVRSAALALGALDDAEQKGFVRFDRGEPKKIIDPRTGLVRITENSAYRNDPAAVGYKVGGNQKYMIFENRELGEAIKRMHADGLGMFQPLLDIQNKIKAMWTHYSPEFLIRHFLFRYPIEGTLNSFEQGAGQVPQYVKEAIPFLGCASRAIFAHNKGTISSNPDVAQMQQYYREMREHGGSMTFRSMRDQDLLTEHLKSKLNSLNRSTWASVKDKHQGMVEAMDVVTNALDNSLRLAAYAAGRRQGKTPEQSALLARDATVDFQLAGKWKNAIGLIFPFGNIAIQTGVRMTSAVARSRTMRRVFMGTMLAGFLAGMFNYLIGGDDDDGVPFMDKIPEWERRLNFTVMNPWHRDAKGRPVPIHIPMPYNWAFPLTIGHAMATMVFGKDKHRIKHMLGMITKSGLEVMTPFGQEENLAALLAPELARPFIHAYTNKNYNGVPVHQDPAFQRKPSSESGRKTTGDGWKYIASAMNAASGGDNRHAGALDFYPEDYRLMFDYVLGGQRRFIENSVNSVKNAAEGNPTDYSKLPLSRVIMGTDYDAADRARRFERKDATKHPWKQ